MFKVYTTILGPDLTKYMTDKVRYNVTMFDIQPDW